MEDETSFSIGKLPTYSGDEIQRHKTDFDTRAQKLYCLVSIYNDKASEVLHDEQLSQAERLDGGELWGNYRDVAQEMANEASKKATACQIELHIRE